MNVSPERWAELEPHLDELVDLDDTARTAYLERIAAGDPETAADLERLLQAGLDDRFLAPLPREAPDLLAALGGSRRKASADLPDLTRRELGPYRLLRTIGRGGMSVVYLAERIDGKFDEQVAVKVLHWTGGRDAIARFRREQQTLARLEHPSIPRILDAGATEEDLPYFVMEYVDGLPITEHCREAGLPLRHRVGLMIDVARTVHDAHRSLIVHRDLKPDNVLVGRDGKPRILDFGIAKWLEEEPGASGTLRTRPGEGLLTPQYASPEQFDGQPVTTASDVYSLGLLLYEVLADRSPYDLAGKPLTDQRRIVCEAEPPAPAERVDDARAARELRGDVAVICAKAMHKEPARRYESAAALADDLRRFLDGLPIEAAPDSLTYRTSKFVRRHHVPVAVAALAAVSLLAGIVGTAWQAREASRERDRARAEAATAREVVDFLAGALEEANPYESLGHEVTVRELLDSSVNRIGSELAGQPAVQARLYSTLSQIVGHAGDPGRGVELAERAITLADSLYGPASVESASARYELARNAYSDPQRRERVLREALGALEARRDPDVREVRADLLEELGLALGRRAEADSALEIQRDVLAMRESLHDPPHRRLARSHHALGSDLSSRGSAEAGEHFAEAARQWRATVGEHHPNYAATLNNWALWHANSGRPDSAEALYRIAFEINRAVLGPRSPELGGHLNNVGRLAFDQGRYDAAEEWLREAVDILSDAEGPDLRYGAALTNLGQVALARGDAEAAEEHLLAGRAVFAQLYGDPSPYTAISDGYLGKVFAAAGRRADATARFESSRAVLGQHLPAMAERLVSVETWQAEMLREAGESEEAARPAP